MSDPEFVLSNEHVEARFDRASGNLTHLSEPGGAGLITGCYCHFYDDDQLVTEDPLEEDGTRFEVVDVRQSGRTVEPTIRTRGVEIVKRFELLPDAPLLRASYTVRGTGEIEQAAHIGFPLIRFTDDFVDAFEDEEDLYFDGAELGDGSELPCWRVFSNAERSCGLMAATRSKYEMSHFQIYERSFDIRPHVMTAYDTDYRLAHSPVPLGEKQEYAASFEIGPWRRDRHDEIIHAAQLDRPHRVSDPPPSGSGRASGELPGVVFKAIDFADAAAHSEDYAPDRWMAARLPFCRSERVLVSQPGVVPPPLTLDPGLKGVCRVYVGVGNGAGVVVKLSGDDMPMFRLADITIEDGAKTPFHLKLTGSGTAREVLICTAEMDGQSLRIERFPSSWATTVIDYVRFEPLTANEEANWRATLSREPCIELSGFSDVPDIKSFTDSRDPDPAAYATNLWEHANAGVRKVFWRIDGQCSDYPSKVNTMRYVSAKVHGVFHPQSKAYGRVLKKTDMLRLAVDAAREHGLKLYGWMRFNSYSGNVQSDFYKEHPELREESVDGYSLSKLCLAHRAVRDHKTRILVEAAGYGLDGLCLGFLRHPPVLHYAPALVGSYRERYGTLPPRNVDSPDPRHIDTLPEADEEHTRWSQHRAEFLTLFGRELRAALSERGLGHVKIAIWVRPNHCLFDGIDLPTWLDEGLCDEVVADAIVAPLFKNRECYDVRPQWKEVVQQKVPLIRGIPGFDFDMAKQMVPEILEQGYDGICTYESDYTVVHDGYRELYWNLRR